MIRSIGAGYGYDMASRDPWFDNAKMALVTLVVVGHALTLLPATTGTSRAYDFLYAWHVPAFVLLTGYLSRSFSWAPGRLWLLARTVVVPYVVFEAVLAWFRTTVGDVSIERLFLDPHWPMWYLAALVVWRLLTPLFLRPPAPVAVAAAVAISLTAGFWAGPTLDLSRAMGLLPFFVLGLRMGPSTWGRLRAPDAWQYAVVGLGLIVALTWSLDRWLSTEWLYYRSPYADLGADASEALLLRLAVLAMGLIGAAAFLTLVPAVAGWFSALGAATLEVYLFHGFVVLGAKYAGYPEWAADHLGTAIWLTPLAAIAVSLLLAAPPVARVLHVAVDPVGVIGRIPGDVFADYPDGSPDTDDASLRKPLVGVGGPAGPPASL